MALESWRVLLTEALSEQGETWGDVEAGTLTDLQLDVPFDSGFGEAEGAEFTLWTARRVYFPVVYDGAEWVGSVSRHPDGRPTPHLGRG